MAGANNSPYKLKTTTIALTDGVFEILKQDAFFFGYVHNGIPNINGFINAIVPVMSDRRDRFHKNLLSENNGDEALCSLIETSIYKNYFDSFLLDDDDIVNVSLRFQRDMLDKFIDIKYVTCSKYDMSFIDYIRSLLEEYVTRNLNQRELIVKSNLIEKIQFGINNERVCNFCIRESFYEIYGELFTGVPVVIKVGRLEGFEVDLNIIALVNNESFQLLPLFCLKTVVVTEEKVSVREEDIINIKAILFGKRSNENEDESIDSSFVTIQPDENDRIRL